MISYSPRLTISTWSSHNKTDDSRIIRQKDSGDAVSIGSRNSSMLLIFRVLNVETVERNQMKSGCADPLLSTWDKWLSSDYWREMTMSMLKIINYKCDTLNFASSSGQERAVQDLSDQGRISFVKYQKSILISPKWFFSHGSSLRLPIRGGSLRSTWPCCSIYRWDWQSSLR